MTKSRRTHIWYLQPLDVERGCGKEQPSGVRPVDRVRSIACSQPAGVTMVCGGEGSPTREKNADKTGHFRTRREETASLCSPSARVLSSPERISLAGMRRGVMLRGMSQ